VWTGFFSNTSKKIKEHWTMAKIASKLSLNYNAYSIHWYVVANVWSLLRPLLLCDYAANVVFWKLCFPNYRVFLHNLDILFKICFFGLKAFFSGLFEAFSYFSGLLYIFAEHFMIYFQIEHRTCRYSDLFFLMQHDVEFTIKFYIY